MPLKDNQYVCHFYYIHTYARACVCIYIYIYIYTHTHTCVCVCVYKPSFSCHMSKALLPSKFRPHWCKGPPHVSIPCILSSEGANRKPLVHVMLLLGSLLYTLYTSVSLSFYKPHRHIFNTPWWNPNQSSYFDYAKPRSLGWAVDVVFNHGLSIRSLVILDIEIC